MDLEQTQREGQALLIIGYFEDSEKSVKIFLSITFNHRLHYRRAQVSYTGLLAESFIIKMNENEQKTVLANLKARLES